MTVLITLLILIMILTASMAGVVLGIQDWDRMGGVAGEDP
jgi:hypothetical protein